MTQPVKNILVYGAGLAFEYAVAALANGLPKDIHVTAVESANAPVFDMCYGQVTTPETYDFHQLIDLGEPALFLNTDTAFSFGTQYCNWGKNGDWIQTFSHPFPVWYGIPFHHHMAKSDLTLESFLPGAQAARNSRFAHPPNDPKVILSRAEYGYQIDPAKVAQFLQKRTPPPNLIRKFGSITKVSMSQGIIKSIQINSKEELKADFYIDSSGPAADLLGQFENPIEDDLRLHLTFNEVEATQTGAPIRQVTAHADGWTSKTPLSKRDIISEVHMVGSQSAALAGQNLEINLGHRDRAWVGNCVGIGHAVSIIEPLTPAPLVTLQRDIKRLMNLIPVSLDMNVEAREYNRLFGEDYSHALMFNNAFYHSSALPESDFWAAMRNKARNPALLRKIEQYKNRGHLVRYDLEPFNEQDWTILLCGMGYKPVRHSVFIDPDMQKDVSHRLSKLKENIDQLVPKLPPHDRYIANFKDYLERKNVS